ncbi:unnamed protein product [Lampetra planeri]
MSKHLKNKNQPTPSSDDDGDLPPAVAVPDLEGADGTAASDTAGVQDVVAGAGPSTSSGAEDGWQLVAEQIDLLRVVLLALTGRKPPFCQRRVGRLLQVTAAAGLAATV